MSSRPALRLLTFILFSLLPGLNGFAAEQLPATAAPLAPVNVLSADITVSDTGAVNPQTPSISYNFSREDFSNPVVEISTSVGPMIVELFPDEAPLAVENFLGLAEGTIPWLDPLSGENVLLPFYDGTIFHRVIDGFIIQGGSPVGMGDGTPGFTFRDEINARSLGLDKMQILNENGEPHPILAIATQSDFQDQILRPLYQQMGISSPAQLQSSVEAVNQRLRNMTVKESYENMGYRYTETVISRMPVRGVIAMANSGPDSNGSQFFITLADTDWLAGKHTVFGKVRVGLDVLDAIGKLATDANDQPLQEVVIQTIRRLNI